MLTIQGRECRRGKDVSKWQGDIDWSQDPDDFAFVKASGGDGSLYPDSKYQRNMALCTKPRGPYHFASAAQNDPVREADYFCDVALASMWSSLPATLRLPAVLDWEPTRNVPGSGVWVLRFLDRVAVRTQIQPIIYTGAFVSLDRVQALRNYDLWLAWYTAYGRRNPNPETMPAPGPCAPWDTWSLWQYSSETDVPGIIGNVDRNVATTEFLRRVLSQPQPAPPAPTPTPTPPVTQGDVMSAQVWIDDTPQDGTHHYLYNYIDIGNEHADEVFERVDANGVVHVDTKTDKDIMEGSLFMSLPRQSLGVAGSEDRDARLARVLRG